MRWSPLLCLGATLACCLSGCRNCDKVETELHARESDVRELRERLEFWQKGSDRAYVYWVERRGRGCFLQATPIDVSSLLEEKLFDSLDTVILTSATLAVGETFEFAERRLGIRHTRSLVVPSHFEYSKQALLYVPQHLPDPRSPAFSRAAAGSAISDRSGSGTVRIAASAWRVAPSLQRAAMHLRSASIAVTAAPKWIEAPCLRHSDAR